MSKNKTVRNIFFTIFCLFACVSLGYVARRQIMTRIAPPVGTMFGAVLICGLNR